MTSLARAVRVLAPNDARLIWRDSFLLLVILVIPGASLGFRWIVPYLTEFLSPWLDLTPYYPLLLAHVIGQQPIVLGAVIGILFIEERDEGTLLALRTTPLSLERFLGYRMIAGMALNVVLTCAAVLLAGIVAVPFGITLLSAAIASLTLPLVALGYALYMQNKVQGVTAMKLWQSWGMLPTLLYFAPFPWHWIGSVPAPLYHPMRFFWTAAEGRPEWWLLVPGSLLPCAIGAWLLRSFRARV